MAEMGTGVVKLFDGIKITDNKRKSALLLHYAGEEVYDVFDTFADTGNDENYDKAKDALKNYFEPKVNKEYERYVSDKQSNRRVKRWTHITPD